MTRIVSFPDGFTSSSAPDVEGNAQEDYELLNNQSSFVNMTGLLLDSAEEKSAYVTMEIERIHTVAAVVTTYRQIIGVHFYHDGTDWKMTLGPASGSDMVQESALSNDYDVVFEIQSAGQVRYKTGNMAGTPYSGNAKVSITRIAA